MEIERAAGPLKLPRSMLVLMMPVLELGEGRTAGAAISPLPHSLRTCMPPSERRCRAARQQPLELGHVTCFSNYLNNAAAARRDHQARACRCFSISPTLSISRWRMNALKSRTTRNSQAMGQHYIENMLRYP